MLLIIPIITMIFFGSIFGILIFKIIRGKDIREPHRDTAKTFVKIMKKNKTKVKIKKFQQ